MSVVITHLSERRRKNERFRRKCLGELYTEMITMEVHDLMLESRSARQDSNDVAHLVALQGGGLDRQLRICHSRGGDEPLLWIADVVLGAINADKVGERHYLEAFSSTFLIHRQTADSIVLQTSEKP